MAKSEIFSIETEDGIATVYDRWAETSGYPEIKPKNNYRMLTADGDEHTITYKVWKQPNFYSFYAIMADYLTM
jgi:hypothetical protein